MKLFIRPIVNKNGNTFNSENPLCHQVAFTVVFSSKRGVTVAGAWFDIDLLSGAALGEVWIRTDLICRASAAYKAAHKGPNLFESIILRVPAAALATNPTAILNHCINSWPFKLSRKQLKKNHKAIRKKAESTTLQLA